LQRPEGDIDNFEYYSGNQVHVFSRFLEGQDLQSLASEHVSVIKTLTEVELARAKLKTKASEKWPQFYVRVEKPLANAPTFDTSISTFVGLRYVPNAGFASFLEEKALSTRVNSAEEITQATRREIHESFENDRQDFLSALVRTRSLERAVSGSTLVLESYQRQFEGGRKSWLDLLNSVRELAQNEYALVDAKAALIASLYKFQIRAGILIEMK
jgi:adhesin transport system outer membrane protein